MRTFFVPGLRVRRDDDLEHITPTSFLKSLEISEGEAAGHFLLHIVGQRPSVFRELH